MKIQFFKPNWSAINKAINSENLKELREAQNELEKKIRNKINAFYKAKKENELIQKIAKLKALPRQSELYFIGRYDSHLFFGQKCLKVSDKRTRMFITANGKNWNCPYHLLRIAPLTEQELKDHKICERLSKAVNNILNR